MFLFIVIILLAFLIAGGRQTLPSLFHLLSVVLVLPSFLFASACLLLQRAHSHGNVFDFIETITSFLVVMYPWGAAVLTISLLTLLAAGFGRRWRRAAASVVVALAAGSAALMHQIAGLPQDSSQWWLFVPGVLAALIGSLLLLALGNGNALLLPGTVLSQTGLGNEPKRP